MPKIKTYPTRLVADVTGDEYVIVTDLSEGNSYKMNLSTVAGEIGQHEITYDHSLIGTNVFNQDLNTTDDVTFNSISGDGSALSNIGNIFNQDLNTTDDVLFNTLSVAGDITIGNVASPTDVTADGLGITLLGDTNKTITWTGNRWWFNQGITSTGFIRSYSNTGALTNSETYSVDATGDLYASAGLASRANVNSGNYFYMGNSEGVGADYFNDITLECRPPVSGDGIVFAFAEYGVAGQYNGTLMEMTPQVVDSGSALAYLFRTGDDLSTSGAKIVSFQNQTTEVMSITVAGVDVTGDVTVGGTIVGLEPWNIVTAGANSGAEDDFTATAGNSYMVDSNLRTGGTITMTLPTTPPAGTVVEVNDMKGDFATTGKSVQTNSTLVNGTTQQFNMDVANSTTKFVYVDGTFGWRTVL